jgi:hypothetical protein
MDALAVERYRYLLAALGAGLVLALVLFALLARRPPASPPVESAPELGARPQVLPHVMLMLVALAVGAGVIVLLPPIVILRYFPGWQVTVLVLAAVALLGAPVLYAWRSRPF